MRQTGRQVDSEATTFETQTSSSAEPLFFCSRSDRYQCGSVREFIYSSFGTRLLRIVVVKNTSEYRRSMSTCRKYRRIRSTCSTVTHLCACRPHRYRLCVSASLFFAVPKTSRRFLREAVFVFVAPPRDEGERKRPGARESPYTRIYVSPATYTVSRRAIRVNRSAVRTGLHGALVRRAHALFCPPHTSPTDGSRVRACPFSTVWVRRVRRPVAGLFYDRRTGTTPGTVSRLRFSGNPLRPSCPRS